MKKRDPVKEKAEQILPEFSEEQNNVIQAWDQGMAVLAGAGSGKTTTLVGKCVRLMQLHPKARFAAVSFTERSASDLREKLSHQLFEISGPGAMSQHWVMTIHGLCGAIIKEYPREAGLDGEESVLAESEAQFYWEKAVAGLWLEEVPDEIRISLEALLDRESQDGLFQLLKRVRELFSFGVLNSLAQSSDSYSKDLSRVAHFVMDRYEREKNAKVSLILMILKEVQIEYLKMKG